MTNPHSQSKFKDTLRINNSYTLVNNEFTSKGKIRTKSIISVKKNYPEDVPCTPS